MTVELDSRGHIDQPVSCARCGYELRGLNPRGACPECGRMIIRSIRGNLLRYADADWVKMLRDGVLAVLIGTLCQALCSALLGKGLVLFGFFLLTRREPGTIGEAAQTPLRTAMLTVAIINFLVEGLPLLSIGSNLTFVHLLQTLIAFVFIFVTGHFAMYYAMRTASDDPLEKIAPRPLERDVKRVMVGLLVSLLVLVILSIGLVIADDVWNLARPAGADGWSVSVSALGRHLELNPAWGVLVLPVVLAVFVFAIWSVALMFQFHARFEHEARLAMKEKNARRGETPGV